MNLHRATTTSRRRTSSPKSRRRITTRWIVLQVFLVSAVGSLIISLSGNRFLMSYILSMSSSSTLTMGSFQEDPPQLPPVTTAMTSGLLSPSALPSSSEQNPGTSANANIPTELPPVLTRSYMMDTGAQWFARSYVDRVQTKIAHAAAAAQNQSADPRRFWCRPTHGIRTALTRSPTNTNTTTSPPVQGIFFVKTPKTASQTINRIIKRLVRGGACHMRAHHVQADPGAWYRHRHSTYSILLTSLRDPATRALSRVYWTLSTRGRLSARNPFATNFSIADVVTPLETWTTKDDMGCTFPSRGGYQLNYVSLDDNHNHTSTTDAWNPKQPRTVQHVDTIHAQVQHVMQDYDIILIKERLDESLVVLQLLLGLEPKDILSVPLHVGGTYLFDRTAGCLALKEPPKLPHLRNNNNNNKVVHDKELTSYLDQYFQSQEWYAKNYGDYVLLGAAHASLDRTIEHLRRQQSQSPSFDEALQKFRQMQQHVQEVCAAQVVFPCSTNGTIQRVDYMPGHPLNRRLGDRYPQDEIEQCLDQHAADTFH